MVIIAVLYALIVWLVFFRLKWLQWGWLTGTVTVLVGLMVCTIFVGFLSNLAPTGRVMVIGHVVEVTANVSGQITESSPAESSAASGNRFLPARAISRARRIPRSQRRRSTAC